MSTYNPTDPVNGLKVGLNKSTTELIITTQGINPTEQLTTTISPSYFEQIKDPTNSIQWTTTNGTVL